MTHLSVLYNKVSQTSSARSVTHMWELDLPANVSKVLVSLHDLGLVGSKVGAHEAERGGMEKEPDTDCSFVACLP